MINQRLKIARQASGLSLRGLQGAIDNLVTAQAIGKYERGEARPSHNVLIAICKALKVQPEQILLGNTTTLESVEFRKSPTTQKREELTVQAQLLQHINNYLAVENALSLNSSFWDCPRGAPYPIRTMADAESAAASIRSHWGLGASPIRNLTNLLEDRGIKVVSMGLTNIDGFASTIKTHLNEVIPVITIKRDSWAERKRFTLSHELAHLIFGTVTELNPEKAANQFAGAFLMPADSLRGEIGNHRASISIGELLNIKKIFGVSIQALVYRCREIGIINNALFIKLFDEFTARGWRSAPYEELGAMNPMLERPTKLEQLCMRGLAEGLITQSLAARALDITLEDLTNMMSGQNEIERF